MRKLTCKSTMIGLALGLGGCAVPDVQIFKTSDQLTAEYEMQDDIYCKQTGLQPGSDLYMRCRLERTQFRADALKRRLESAIPQ
jgi:hypothetical protein